MPTRLLCLMLLLCCLSGSALSEQARVRTLSIAILDFGGTTTGRRAAERLAGKLAADNQLSLLDRDESRAAARGAGYNGSLNLTLFEARDLGLALGSDFYLIGEAQTIRRSPSNGAAYYESYAALFLVSTRTGKLVRWERPSAQAASEEAAERLLMGELDKLAARYHEAVSAASERERQERAEALEHRSTPFEDAPEEGSPKAEGVRLPAPYRRLQPAYTEAAARSGIEAVVDVQVEIDTGGEVARAEVVRWAGYGLDESTLETVRQLHFRPATREGAPFPIRVLLRYNFRRPQK